MKKNKKNDILDTILNLLNVKNKKKNDINYLENGMLDSLQMINFISTLEKKFKIKFIQKDFEKRDFVNILGLKNIIEKKLNLCKSSKKNLQKVLKK
jgi:acyl carrier protein